MANIDLADKSVRDYLVSIKHEAMKLYRFYDASSRVQYQYEAPSKALDGDPCMRTEYVYDGSSTRVVKMKETMDNWQAIWDV